MSFVIRPATVDDRDGIVRVFLACWHGSYASVLPQRLVDGMDERRANALWDRVLAEAQPSEIIVAAQDVVADGGDSIGVTRFAVGPDGAGLVHSLYVSPAEQGQGLGARLLTVAVGALADAGCGSATLWVFRNNAPSIEFYRRHGWLPDGGERVQPDFGEPELRLSRTLAPESRSSTMAVGSPSSPRTRAPDRDGVGS